MYASFSSSFVHNRCMSSVTADVGKLLGAVPSCGMRDGRRVAVWELEDELEALGRGVNSRLRASMPSSEKKHSFVESVRLAEAPGRLEAVRLLLDLRVGMMGVVLDDGFRGRRFVCVLVVGDLVVGSQCRLEGFPISSLDLVLLSTSGRAVVMAE